MSSIHEQDNFLERHFTYLQRHRNRRRLRWHPRHRRLLPIRRPSWKDQGDFLEFSYWEKIGSRSFYVDRHARNDDYFRSNFLYILWKSGTWWLSDVISGSTQPVFSSTFLVLFKNCAFIAEKQKTIIQKLGKHKQTGRVANGSENRPLLKVLLKYSTIDYRI